MQTLTYDAAVAALTAVADADPYRVYQRTPFPRAVNPDDDFGSCAYLTENGMPSCIIGAAFYADILDAGLHYEHPVNFESADDLFAHVLHRTYTLTFAASEFLRAVQTYQDSGVPWGEAVREAQLLMDDDDTDKGF